MCSQISGNKIGFDIDVLFNIFTPANYQSFYRILKKDGIMVKVIPGAEYLKEFRDAAGIKSQRDEEILSSIKQVTIDVNICVCKKSG